MIYLEPRKTFDVAIIEHKTITYSFTKIIEVLILNGMSWLYAVDFYYHNIEPLIKYEGLNVLDDEL